MKIFISWSGERSKAVARALHEWIPLVLDYAKPWMSEQAIAAGERWSEAIAKELEESNFGIICITQQNIDSQWVSFEAGALAKSLTDSRVIPLLLDLDLLDLSGPLGQFQAKKVEKQGLEEVISSINQKASNPAAEPLTKARFDGLWPQFEAKISTIPTEQSTKRSRPQELVLEELVASVRSLEARLRDIPEALTYPIRPSRRRLHPFMLEEITHMVGMGSDDPIELILIASMFRDDLPWLYEIGIEAYRTAKHGSPDEVEEAIQRFSRAIDIMARGPFAPEEMGDHKSIHMALEALQNCRRARHEREACERGPARGVRAPKRLVKS